MPAGAVALILAAAVAHASWNYFAKGAQSSASFIFAFCAVAVATYLPIGAIYYVIARPSPGPEALLWVAVSGLLNTAYFIFLSEGYRHGDLSLVYPLARGTGPALSVVGAIIIFGERPSPLAVAGTALVVAGILTMSWSPGRTTGAEVRRSIIFALLTGATIAAYTLWDARGVEIVPPVLYSVGLDFWRAAFVAPLALGTSGGRATLRDVVRHQRTAVLAIGILSPGAYLLVLIALTIAPVSYVAPARELSILFGALLGLRLLREPDAGRRIAGALAIVAGVFALALG